MSSIAAITTTPAGLRCLAPLCEGERLDGTTREETHLGQLWIAPSLQLEAATLGLSHRVYKTSLSAFLQAHWQEYEGFVFCLASGAVVRLIAPLLTHKSIDPAVVVVDPAGKVAISLCSGHRGGGDRLTWRVSQLLEAQPILTGAANNLELPAIDTLGKPFGWKKGTGDW